MRIISGVHRSRRLIAPDGVSPTRPITDRVKQSLFDRLWSMGMVGEDGATFVLDLFAGTGSLGLEALSRGAERCTFVERHRDVRKSLEKNLANLGLAEAATVLGIDALAPGWVEQLQPLPGFGLIFCDPPYDLTTDPLKAVAVADLIQRLASVAAIAAVLVLRVQSHTRYRTVAGWDEPAVLVYGSMALHIYEKSTTSDAD